MTAESRVRQAEQYERIRLLESRFVALHAAARQMFGIKGDELYAEVILAYGKPQTEERPTFQPEVSGSHAVLADIGRRAELREAKYISALLALDEPQAQALLTAVWSQHGRQCGMARRGVEPGDARSAVAAMRKAYLDGMPCDTRDAVLRDEPQHYSWAAAHCLHRDLWREAGVSAEYMQRLYGIWFQAFFRGLQAGCRFVVEDTANPPIYHVVATR